MWSRRPLDRLILAVFLLPAGMLGGCATSEGPDAVTLDASQYQAAFDAAVEAAREQDMPPILQDRRSGIIETDARIAASLLEPWRNDNASMNQAVENTVAM